MTHVAISFTKITIPEDFVLSNGLKVWFLEPYRIYSKSFHKEMLSLQDKEDFDNQDNHAILEIMKLSKIIHQMAPSVPLPYPTTIDLNQSIPDKFPIKEMTKLFESCADWNEQSIWIKKKPSKSESRGSSETSESYIEKNKEELLRILKEIAPEEQYTIKTHGTVFRLIFLIPRNREITSMKKVLQEKLTGYMIIKGEWGPASNLVREVKGRP